ncbi:hypothetical protein [Streptomyces sp. NPDC088775]|uniref:hypothetical protein n=1 Tax=Streptomyces sp. NPDC088775 TaxID=3365896 RepID=UPI0037F4270C
MPRHLDQLPPDITTMSRKIASLQRDLRELRAAKRAAYTTVTNGKTTYASESGWEIVMDPANVLPIIYFRDPTGAEMAALNATGSPGRPGYDLSSGPFGDDDAADWRWVTFAGQSSDGSINNWVTTRMPTSQVNRQLGGWLYLDPSFMQCGLVNTDTGINQLFQITGTTASIFGARLTVSPPASSSAASLVAAPAGHTGTLLSLSRGGTAMATVSGGGDAAFAGQVTAQTLNIGSGSSSIGGDLSIGGAVMKAGETWKTPAFGTNWASGTTLGGNATFRGLQYRKTADDEVRVLGAAVSSGTGTTITTLPAGYRPPTNQRCLIRAYFSTGTGTPTSGWAQVTEAGVIAVGASIAGFTVASGTQVWLDGSFPLGNLT